MAKKDAVRSELAKAAHQYAPKPEARTSPNATSNEVEKQEVCPLAGQQTGGKFYCKREAGHSGPCAAVPREELMRCRSRLALVRELAGDLARQLKLWWTVKSYPLYAKLAWPLGCAFGFHGWEEAPAFDHAGEPVANRPGLFRRCKRPGCRVYGDRPQLKVIRDEAGVVLWAESDDFEVLANGRCGKCHGRGYSQKMILPGGVKAKLPCSCIRVQPRFIERVKA